MGQHIITGNDGSTLTLNFMFDNGLPTKPIINPAYQSMYSESSKQHALYIYLEEEDLIDLGNSIKSTFFVLLIILLSCTKAIILYSVDK